MDADGAGKPALIMALVHHLGQRPLVFAARRQGAENDVSSVRRTLRKKSILSGTIVKTLDGNGHLCVMPSIVNFPAETSQAEIKAVSSASPTARQDNIRRRELWHACQHWAVVSMDALKFAPYPAVREIPHLN
ncbi:MAG: hypothetical protein Q9188_000999 [Gyalolechia gomerana]